MTGYIVFRAVKNIWSDDKKSAQPTKYVPPTTLPEPGTTLRYGRDILEVMEVTEFHGDRYVRCRNTTPENGRKAIVVLSVNDPANAYLWR